MNIVIDKEKAEFIKNTSTKVVGENFWDKTYFLPVFFKMTEVMIDSNVVTGKHKGEWIEYTPEFTEEAFEILGIM